MWRSNYECSIEEGKIVFQLEGTEYTTYTTVSQYDYEHEENAKIELHKATVGNGIPLYIIGDGFTASSIADGTYLKLMKEQMEYFFGIEPYKTYKNYFNVSTAIAVSGEEGITPAELREQRNKFNTCLDIYGLHCDTEKVKAYLKEYLAPGDDLKNAIILVVANYSGFISTTLHEKDGSSISLCTLSNDIYPYDQRGMIQHEVGGHNFGRLGDESISHFEFIRACTCPSCNAYNEFKKAKAKGEMINLSLSGNINQIPWKELMFHPQYSDIVDVYEGGYNHLRGVFRSEAQSCMGTYIGYFNSISRMHIVRRIMELSGKEFDFGTFVSNDNRDGMPGNENNAN